MPYLPRSRAADMIAAMLCMGESQNERNKYVDVRKALCPCLGYTERRRVIAG